MSATALLDGLRSAATHLECSECFREAPLNALQRTCSCGGMFLVRYDLSRVAVTLDTCWNRGLGVWSFTEVLPVQDSALRRGLGEGGTPLLDAPTLAHELGVGSVCVKDEGVNPTGSFKARGMALAVARAKELGAPGLMLPTAGNAGVAAAAYGAYWDLPVTVSMPEDTPFAFSRDAELHGATCHRIPGSIADAGAWLASSGNPHPDRFSLATLREPYRVEGKKTMGYELVAQGGGRWPDVVLYPTGGGTGIIGMWKAHQELRDLGWVEGPPPRFVVVQSEGCAPLVRAFHEGEKRARPWENPQTYALGLRVPGSLGDHMILQCLRDSQGTAVTVSEQAIEAAVLDMVRKTGVCPAPEAAATWAAALTLSETGWLQSTDRVCLFVTGSGVVGSSGTQIRREAS